MKYLRNSTMMFLLAAGLVALLLAALDMPASADPAATTRHVAPGGACGGASPCYATIQAAVDAANPGDVIKVAAGTYNDIHVRQSISQVVYIDKAVTLGGGYTPTNWTTPDPVAHPTILDARSKGRGLYLSGPITVTIRGFRITGGDATGLGGSWRGDVGGGLFLKNISGEIADNRIFGNKAAVGAGLFLNKSPLKLEDNQIFGNTASNVGGGLDGGHSDITLNRNAFYNNKAGGMNLSWGTITMNGNIIRNNTGMWNGGGVYFGDCDATLINNLILGNQVEHTGSGVFADAGSHLHLLHTTFARNISWGAAIYINNTSTLMMTNTIISSHTVGIEAATGTTATLASTLWHSNTTDRTGVGTIKHTSDHNGDPKFAFDGYHLLPGSAAINSGVNAGVGTDIDGNARPYGAGYDIGADEFNGTVVQAKKLFLPLSLH